MTDYTPGVQKRQKQLMKRLHDASAPRLKQERDDLLEALKSLLHGVPNLPAGKEHIYGSPSLNGDTVATARELIERIES